MNSKSENEDLVRKSSRFRTKPDTKREIGIGEGGSEKYYDIGCECGVFVKIYMSKERYQNVAKEEFVCGLCVGKDWECKIEEFEKLKEKLERKEGIIEKLKKELQESRESTKRMEEAVQQKCEEVQRSNEVQERRWATVVSETTELNKTMRKVEEELESKEKVEGDLIRQTIKSVDREKNIIVRGMKDTEEDMKIMEEILKELAQWKGVEQKEEIKVQVKKMERLGEKREGRIQPVRIELGSLFQVRRVIRNKARLRNNEKYKHLMLDEDLNFEERSRRAELRKEVKALREEGKACYLWQGKIKMVEQRDDRRKQEKVEGESTQVKIMDG